MTDDEIKARVVSDKYIQTHPTSDIVCELILDDGSIVTGEYHFDNPQDFDLQSGEVKAFQAAFAALKEKLGAA